MPGLEVVGITGSSGKTSTKDLLGAVLATVGPTVAPVGSYNSEVGVPLTVCRVTADTRFLVVEMGARGIGHVAHLARMAPPRVGVVLNVGTAHVGEFGSREAIARPSPSSSLALPPTASPCSTPTTPRCARWPRSPRPGSSSSGRPRTPRCAPPTSRSTPAAGPRSPSRRAGGRAGDLGLVGRHHVGNALAVLAVATELGMPFEQACAALESARPASRGGWRSSSGTTASPSSTTPTTPTPTRCAPRWRPRADGEGRRTWAVLGTMLELGDESDALHAEVGAEVVARDVDELVVVGGRRRPSRTACARGGPGRHPAVAPAPARRAGSSPTPTPPRRCCATSCGRVTWCCSSRAATRVYGCSVTDWPGRGRS